MTGFVRQPRCLINGIVPIECSVHVSQHQSADTFAAQIAADAPDGMGVSFWANTLPIPVTVMATNDIAGGGLTQMFTGNVDRVEIEWETRIVSISGRDMTSTLHDGKTNEKWLNKQPQDIIQDLAGRVGLGVQFSSGSSDRAGLKFKDDYNRISELDSYWNVIVRLAKELGCIAYVKGNTLIVAPWNAGQGGTYNVFYQGPTPASPAMGTVLKLHTARDLHLGKTIKVNHKAWQHKEGQALESEFMLNGKGGTLQHSLKGANLTKQQQDAIAKGRINEIVSREMEIAVHTFGDVTISPSGMVSLSGTGTAFDQSYVISDIEHHWTQNAGYLMHIRGRNMDSQRGEATQTK
jgi:phage protein D